MGKILCIEDEDYLREDIIEELEEAGHVVVEAVNGQDGLEKILSERPDLVISDITMPVMNGYELIKQLRDKHPECDEIPFIFLSALADRENILEGLKLGSNDYITKPIDYEMLLINVASRLRHADRLIEKKHKEQIKLYQSLKKNNPEEPAALSTQYYTDNPREILIVGESDQNLWKFHQLLEQVGHFVTVVTSGVAYLKKQKTLKSDITFFWPKTDDIEVKNILSEVADENSGPFFLIVHQRANVALNAGLSEELLSKLYNVICLPSPDEKILQEIQDCLEVSAVA